VKWYVLHVLAGRELDVKRRLQDEGITAAVLQEAVQIRRRGKWHQEQRTVFPGYVFLNTDLTESAYYALKGIPGAIRLLPKGGPPIPLLPEDVTVLLHYGLDSVMPLSSVSFSGGEPKKLSGPLKDWEDYIVKIDRRRRRAQLLVPVLGEKKSVTLYIELV
jgi:transcriptional antiterminator NusG